MGHATGAERYIVEDGRDGVPFPVAEHITRKIENVSQLEERFESPGSEVPVHLIPDSDAIYSSPRAEFVSLSQVVGGADAARYHGTFLVYPEGEEAEGRGRNHVLEICRSYVEGRNLDPHSPQQYYEKDGLYYVTSGRHSTAALKALGVPRIPALVTHISFPSK